MLQPGHSLCNRSYRNTREPQEVNIGLGNGLVPSGTKPLPEPMLTPIYVTMLCHQATMS